ncbi:protein tamozhennic [Hetaerina americana]|uniref:protein tamozhennic n=1 Tax=Hetaerina americana TaxID=62018 RepID=UPI003A7F4B26
MGETRVHLPHHQQQMYCFGQSRPSAHHFSHASHSDHRNTQLCVLIDQLHLSYLHTEASPHKIEQRSKLESHIWEYLCEVPHDRKFTFPQTAQILRRSASVATSPSTRTPYQQTDSSSQSANYSFNGFRAASAWKALDHYAVNLLSQPWRKEFREMKLYSGFYKYEVETHLIGAEVMFELMGYRKLGSGAMSLEGPIDPDRVASVSRDALFAYVECQILCAIWGMVPRKFSWLDLIEFRESHVSGPEAAARVLTMRYLSATSNNPPIIAAYCAERSEHQRKVMAAHQNHQYNYSTPAYHQVPVSTSSCSNSLAMPSRKLSQTGSAYGWPLQGPAMPNPKQKGLPAMGSALGSDDFYPNGYAVHPGHLLQQQCNTLAPSHRFSAAHDCGQSGLVYPCTDHYHCATHANGYHAHVLDTTNPPAVAVPTAQLVEVDGARALPYCPQSAPNYFSQLQSHPAVSVPVSPCQANVAFGIDSQSGYSQQSHMTIPHSLSYTTVLMANATLDSAIRRRGNAAEEARDRQRASFHTRRDETDGIAGDRMTATMGRGYNKPKMSYVSDNTAPVDGETLGSWSYVFRDLETQGYTKDLGDREDVLNPRYREGNKLLSEEEVARNVEMEMKNVMSERSTAVPLADPVVDKMGKTLQKLRLDPKKVSGSEEEKRRVSKSQAASHVPDEKPVSIAKELAGSEAMRGISVDRSSDKLGASSSNSIRNHETDRGSVGSGRVVQPSEEEKYEDWECIYCTFRNVSGGVKRDVCEICGKSRRRGAEERPLASGGRECPKCTLVNVKEASACEACGASLAHSPTYI